MPTCKEPRKFPWNLHQLSVLTILVLGLSAIPFAGCNSNSAAFTAGFLKGLTQTPAASQPPAELLLFGGQGHKTFLGCLNCSKLSTDSVLNEYSQYGNSYSSESIWNDYSQFGSSYSMYSACNSYANDPPIIVDKSGNYYGRLTLNLAHPELGEGRKLYEWLKQAVCKSN